MYYYKKNWEKIKLLLNSFFRRRGHRTANSILLETAETKPTRFNNSILRLDSAVGQKGSPITSIMFNSESEEEAKHNNSEKKKNRKKPRAYQDNENSFGCQSKGWTICREREPETNCRTFQYCQAHFSSPFQVICLDIVYRLRIYWFDLLMKLDKWSIY